MTAKYNRIVLIALAVGLILALAVIFVIPNGGNKGSSLFAPNNQTATSYDKSSDSELLNNIDEEMTSMDQEYNFNSEPSLENLQSPDFATDTQAVTQ